MIAALSAPPAPFVPEEHHFAPGIALLVAGFAGEQPHGQVVARARDAVAPLFEFSLELPYTALQSMLDESAPYGVAHAYNKALFLDRLSDDAIGVLAAALPGRTSR